MSPRQKIQLTKQEKDLFKCVTETKNPFDKTDRKGIAVLKYVTETQIALTKQEKDLSNQMCHRDKVSICFTDFLTADCLSVACYRNYLRPRQPNTVSQNGVCMAQIYIRSKRLR